MRSSRADTRLSFLATDCSGKYPVCKSIGDVKYCHVETAKSKKAAKKAAIKKAKLEKKKEKELLDAESD